MLMTIGGFHTGDAIVLLIYFFILIAIIIGIILLIVKPRKKNNQLDRIEEKIDKILSDKER